MRFGLPTRSASRTEFVSRLNTQRALSPIDLPTLRLARPLTFETSFNTTCRFIPAHRRKVYETL
jgi:hypothetical protein